MPESKYGHAPEFPELYVQIEGDEETYRVLGYVATSSPKVLIRRNGKCQWESMKNATFVNAHGRAIKIRFDTVQLNG